MIEIGSLALAVLALVPLQEPGSGTAQERPDGPYLRTFDSGEVAAEGAFLDGAPDGPWKTFHPDGSLRTTGSYNQGRRTGKWEFFHPNGQLAASGSYRLGLKDRKWVFLDPQGAKIEADSGLYRTESALYESREKRFLVETLEDRRHGRWISWWESGALQLEGEYRQGKREGRWTLWHMDGSVEPDYLTGFYRAGERVADAEASEDPFAIPEELTGGGEPHPPDTTVLPHLGRLPWVKLSQRNHFKEWIVIFLDDPDQLERAKAEQILLQYGRDVVADLLNRLAELDLEDETEADHARRLVGLLQSICKGRGFGWKGRPEGLDEDRRAILCWFSWWELGKLEDTWWAQLGANAVPSDLLTTELIDGVAPPPSVAAARGADPNPADAEIETVRSDLFRERARARRPGNVKTPIEEGLVWLANHQSPNGSWDAAGFAVECVKRGAPECDGPGVSTNDVGVTALALQAFLADGNTTSSGDHSRVVLAAVHWLFSVQDLDTGLFGEKLGHSFIYNHALATQAICEVVHFTESEQVRVAAQRAVDLCLAARNPLLAWRYDIPPIGDNDTSVTGWMIHALHSARSAGLEVDPIAFEGARKWLDQVSEEETGRVGYDSIGSLSSRVQKINEHFPPENGESMTAVGLFTRFLLGQTPSSEPMMQLHADLLLEQLPEWAPADFDCDMYYWYHGTNAMHQMGGSHWDRWSSALDQAVLGGQKNSRSSCLHGSWDPVGPWGYSGGRVYSTALMVLCLQGGFRYPRLARR